MSSNRMDHETMSYYLEKGMSIREWIMKTCLTMQKEEYSNKIDHKTISYYKERFMFSNRIGY